MDSVRDSQLKLAGFPHSEIPGSKPVCRLPEAYRRLPRPSSPSAAKASTECACSLDHITQPAWCGRSMVDEQSPVCTCGCTTALPSANHTQQASQPVAQTHFRYFFGLSIPPCGCRGTSATKGETLGFIETSCQRTSLAGQADIQAAGSAVWMSARSAWLNA